MPPDKHINIWTRQKMSKGLCVRHKKICLTGKLIIYVHASSSVTSAHLWPDSSPVTEQLGVGLDVVGVYCQCCRVELVRSLVVALFERLVPFFLLRFKCFGILRWQEAGYPHKRSTIHSDLGLWYSRWMHGFGNSPCMRGEPSHGRGPCAARGRRTGLPCRCSPHSKGKGRGHTVHPHWWSPFGGYHCN